MPAGVEPPVLPRDEAGNPHEHREKGAPDRHRHKGAHDGTLQHGVERPQPRVAERNGEKGEQQAPFEDRDDDPRGGSPRSSLRPSESGKAAPIEKRKKGKTRSTHVIPGHRRIEDERRRRQLRVEQPRRQVGIPGDVTREDHPHDGKSPQDVHGIGTIIHSGSFSLIILTPNACKNKKNQHQHPQKQKLLHC